MQRELSSTADGAYSVNTSDLAGLHQHLASDYLNIRPDVFNAVLDSMIESKKVQLPDESVPVLFPFRPEEVAAAQDSTPELEDETTSNLPDFAEQFIVHAHLAGGGREEIQSLLKDAGFSTPRLQELVRKIDQQLADANSDITVRIDKDGALILIDRTTNEGFRIDKYSVVGVKQLPDGSLWPEKELDWNGKNDKRIAEMLQTIGKDAPLGYSGPM
jgi:hypothetical protein